MSGQWGADRPRRPAFERTATVAASAAILGGAFLLAWALQRRLADGRLGVLQDTLLAGAFVLIASGLALARWKAELTRREAMVRTERLRAGEELRRASERLATSERLASLGVLAAGVAHEINNPLTWVISNVRVAEAVLANQPGDASAAAREALRDAEDGA